MLVLRSNEVILWVKIKVGSRVRGTLNQRLLLMMQIGRRLTVTDNSSLCLRCTLFLNCLRNRSGAVLWQLNYGSYGTFEFFFVVNFVVRLAVMIVGRSKSYMNSTVTFVLHRIWANDSTKGRGFQQWKRSNDLNSFWFFVIFFFFLIMTNRRQRWNWVMNNQPTLLIFLVFHIKNLNLFFLFLSRNVNFRWWKCFIVVLNDNLDDWLQRLRVMMWTKIV